MSQDNLKPLVKFDDAILANLCRAEQEQDEQPVTRPKAISTKWVYDDTGFSKISLPARFRD